MTPNEPHAIVDWVRLLIIPPAIIISNLCFCFYVGAGMGSSPNQHPIQLLIFLLPTPFCMLLIGVFCKSRLELIVASLLALFLWLSVTLLALPSLTMSYSPADRSYALSFGSHILLIGLCALCALLGQRLRRFLWPRSSNNNSLTVLRINNS